MVIIWQQKKSLPNEARKHYHRKQTKTQQINSLIWEQSRCLEAMVGETSNSTKQSFVISLPWTSVLGFNTEHWSMSFSKQVGPVEAISYLFMWLFCPTQIKKEILPPGGLYIQNDVKFYLGSTLGEEHNQPQVTLNWEVGHPNKRQTVCPEGPLWCQRKREAELCTRDDTSLCIQPGWKNQSAQQPFWEGLGVSADNRLTINQKYVPITCKTNTLH